MAGIGTAEFQGNGHGTPGIHGTGAGNPFIFCITGCGNPFLPPSADELDIVIEDPID